ncbi:hypothetical protein CoNPh2_CDS0002 [Staphylococcus phage S-CoN_Ph2]|nr:hypothetical protein CoNPh1_CDS0158 [Staphylococcus phage S-CoN_Ph1]WNM51557.1 hypothetical protein CoNPh2_CDS0002 [Staphylococcus phage S-CoN_Ph2]WNM51717.1 hypothetical protein CoNPh3_CDS0002 [Staphylococcus phage S-CoN_Ph3]WNM52047.1 hypothetical protein CoNPh4_CDS0172 [Staphylococcus phage S-CoN_Ph4]WNM52058.1 hypothetical protein CoNPh5_CDS0012 [Staphylococcus phage S-CoN_Ph5]WNM52213.1 hypothetical protein CoNPh6_CDS0002 [Staphylococcus phage S-CoN_Ph6]WNM52375.1 hypothetical protein
MEIGKVYYVIMENERFFEEEVKVYGSEVTDTIVITTKDINEAKIFDDLPEAKEAAERYGFELKGIKTDFI